MISSSHRPSWYGYVATAASSSPITSPTSPSRSRAENWVSMSFMRASSSRARCGVDPVAVAGRRQHIPAVQLQRRRAQVGGAAVVAGVEQPRRGGGVAQHGERIDLGRLDGELVAAVAAGDHRRIPERPAQPGDLRLQRVAAGVDGVGGPQVVDEPVGAHEQPGLEREAHQQLRRLAARHRHELAVAPDLDGAQHRDLEHGESLWPASARCQRSVSASLDGGPMPPTHPEQLLHQLVVGDAAAIAAIVEASRTSDDPMILVAAALFAPDGDGLMARAGGMAATTRDRQLVAIATAHLRGERDLVDALARDHLVDHPDNVLVAWIAGASHRPRHPPRTRSCHERASSPHPC